MGLQRVRHHWATFTGCKGHSPRRDKISYSPKIWHHLQDRQRKDSEFFRDLAVSVGCNPCVFQAVCADFQPKNCQAKFSVPKWDRLAGRAVPGRESPPVSIWKSESRVTTRRSNSHKCFFPAKVDLETVPSSWASPTVEIWESWL